MGVKLALVLAFVVLASDASKASAGVVVLVGSLVHLASARPYASRVHQHVAVVTQSAVALALLGGSFDATLFRRGTVVVGVLGTLLAIAVGLALDMWLYRKQTAAAAREWRGTKPDEVLGDMRHRAWSFRSVEIRA